MGWQVILSRSARADLEGLVRYIARDNPDAAARVGYELVVHAERLSNFPELGRIVPEFGRADLREIVVRSYRVIYRLRPACGQIQIVRFWHGARGFPRIPREESA